MITEQVTQGTSEWMVCRVGIPTASNFDKLLTLKGEPSKQRTKYMYQLAAERITGIKEESYQNGNMQRGIELEAQARSAYTLITGHNVEEVGVCYANEDKKWGCSPDGLVGKDGLVEIKCPLSYTHVGYLLDNVLPSDYFQQIQGQLLITGRKWVDFFSFFPGLKPLLIKVTPDEYFIQRLRVELEVFCRELDDITERIKQ